MCKDGIQFGYWQIPYKVKETNKKSPFVFNNKHRKIKRIGTSTVQSSNNPPKGV
jgi:hypothetical protein